MGWPRIFKARKFLGQPIEYQALSLFTQVIDYQGVDPEKNFWTGSTHWLSRPWPKMQKNPIINFCKHIDVKLDV